MALVLNKESHLMNKSCRKEEQQPILSKDQLYKQQMVLIVIWGYLKHHYVKNYPLQVTTY